MRFGWTDITADSAVCSWHSLESLMSHPRARSAVISPGRGSLGRSTAVSVAGDACSRRAPCTKRLTVQYDSWVIFGRGWFLSGSWRENHHHNRSPAFAASALCSALNGQRTQPPSERIIGEGRRQPPTSPLFSRFYVYMFKKKKRLFCSKSWSCCFRDASLTEGFFFE